MGPAVGNLDTFHPVIKASLAPFGHLRRENVSAPSMESRSPYRCFAAFLCQGEIDLPPGLAP